MEKLRFSEKNKTQRKASLAVAKTLVWLNDNFITNWGEKMMDSACLFTSMYQPNCGNSIHFFPFLTFLHSLHLSFSSPNVGILYQHNQISKPYQIFLNEYHIFFNYQNKDIFPYNWAIFSGNIGIKSPFESYFTKD